MHIDLKLCPFCKGKAVPVGNVMDGYFVTCVVCHASSARMRTEMEAADRWNKRVEDDPIYPTEGRTS